ncbi:MAG: MoaD/ThiS family protein [Wenzhouxiangella sp.]
MPRIQIELPSALRVLADGRATIALEADRVGRALDRLGAQHPHVLSRILTRGGAMRPHVNLFVNDTDIRQRQGLDTALNEGDLLMVVPSVAGG